MKNKFSNLILQSVLAVFCAAEAVYAQNKHIGSIIARAKHIPHSAGLKTVVVKFSLVIFAVVLFSLILYFGLLIYNKYFVSKEIKDFSLDKDSLRTPRDSDEAINMFIARNRIK